MELESDEEVESLAEEASLLGSSDFFLSMSVDALGASAGFLSAGGLSSFLGSEVSF